MDQSALPSSGEMKQHEETEEKRENHTFAWLRSNENTNRWIDEALPITFMKLKYKVLTLKGGGSSHSFSWKWANFSPIRLNVNFTFNRTAPYFSGFSSEQGVYMR